MPREFDVREVEGADEVPFNDDEIEQLAKLHLMAFWPVLKSALLRYQARALGVITNPKAEIEAIRESQGRMDMARQLLDLLESDAPRKYKKRQEQDANDTDDSAGD